MPFSFIPRALSAALVYAALQGETDRCTCKTQIFAMLAGPLGNLWLGRIIERSEEKEEGDEFRGKESTEKEESSDPVPVFIRSLNGRTHTLLLSPLDDVSTLLSRVEDKICVPQHLWYVRSNGRPLPGLSSPHGLSRDDVLTVHAGLAGGAPPPRVPGEWYCNVCQRGGCWPARMTCFRCGISRKDSDAVNTPQVVPPRERQFPGRAPAQERSAGCPTERKPPPQSARKNNGIGNDKAAIARVVLETLANIDLDPEVLGKIRLQLFPPPAPVKPSKRLAELEEKIEKVTHDVARLKSVVQKKQVELRQAEERAENKAKELRDLNAELIQVKKEVTQVFPTSVPATPPSGPTIVPLEEEDSDGDGDLTPMAQNDDAYLGLHHGAFDAPGMEVDAAEPPDDSLCLAQVKRVKANPHPNFDQTCHDIGAGRFSKDQLSQLVQLASMHSETTSQAMTG